MWAVRSLTRHNGLSDHAASHNILDVHIDVFGCYTVGSVPLCRGALAYLSQRVGDVGQGPPRWKDPLCRHA